MSESKPSSETHKQIKNYEFCRKIVKEDKDKIVSDNNISENKTPMSDNTQILLSFNIILYEEEIAFKIKEVKDDLDENSSFYEKSFNYDDFKEINDIFKYYKNLNTIFDSIKSHFDKNKDVVVLEDDNIIIKLKINLDIFEESFSLIIPLIQKTSEDNIKNLTDSIFYLNKEKITLKQEIANLKNKENNLNETVSILKKELSEVSKYIKEKLTPNEDNESIIKSFEVVREIKKNIRIGDEEEEEKIENNEIIDNIENTSTPCPEDKDLDIFTISLKLLLYKEKIKIYINEIQDDLKTNYLEYEKIFTKDYFDKNKIKFDEGIENIYEFLCNLFDEQNDHLIKDGDNKIIINLTFPLGLKKETITLEINRKRLSLEKSLNNSIKTVQILNKENKSLKDETSIIKSKEENDIKGINRLLDDDINALNLNKMEI